MRGRGNAHRRRRRRLSGALVTTVVIALLAAQGAQNASADDLRPYECHLTGFRLDWTTGSNAAGQGTGVCTDTTYASSHTSSVSFTGYSTGYAADLSLQGTLTVNDGDPNHSPLSEPVSGKPTDLVTPSGVHLRAARGTYTCDNYVNFGMYCGAEPISWKADGPVELTSTAPPAPDVQPDDYTSNPTTAPSPPSVDDELPAPRPPLPDALPFGLTWDDVEDPDPDEAVSIALPTGVANAVKDGRLSMRAAYAQAAASGVAPVCNAHTHHKVSRRKRGGRYVYWKVHDHCNQILYLHGSGGLIFSASSLEVQDDSYSGYHQVGLATDVFVEKKVNTWYIHGNVYATAPSGYVWAIQTEGCSGNGTIQRHCIVNSRVFK
jgi:hypothetical protein